MKRRLRSKHTCSAPGATGDTPSTTRRVRQKRDGEEGVASEEASDKVGAGRAVPQPAPRQGKHSARPKTLSAAPRCRSKHTCSALGAAGNTPSTTRRVRQKRDGEEGAAGEEASDKVGAGQAVPQPPPPRKTKSAAQPPPKGSSDRHRREGGASLRCRQEDEEERSPATTQEEEE